MRKLAAVAVASMLAATVAGCVDADPLGDDSPPQIRYVEPEPEPDPSEWDLVEGAAVEPAPPVWTCVYSVTLNDDWHDDVLCSNGVEVVRPYLREWDSFVTYEEIMESARELEAELNG